MSEKRFEVGKSEENSLFSEVLPIALSIQRLAKQARQQYSMEVDAVIREQSHSRKRIEHLLDGMLDFCFDDGMLTLYKKLCRYYFPIAPDATASYIYAYRDLWDTEQGGQGE
ncbi:MAG: hypothetical protein HZA08_08220 [Nitrospirae bacterium]|nr:hypothetical protein [Nitrospirota bacterium]